MSWITALYNDLGIFYFIVLPLSTLGIAILGALAGQPSTNRRPMRGFWALCLLPFLIGVYGTWEGYEYVNSTLYLSEMPAGDAAISYSSARVTSYVGAVLSAALALFGLLLSSLRPKQRNLATAE